MKKYIITAIILAILVSLIGIMPMAYAKDDNHGLVYQCALIDGPNSDTVAYGEVMVWYNYQVKVMLVVESETVDVGEQTYAFALNYGPPTNRDAVFVGNITTDKKGKAIEFFTLPPKPVDAPPVATTPGFIISLIGGPPGMGSSIATTGFDFPPAP
jgi:hypothetical protein